MDKRVLLTKTGYEDLKAELERLINVDYPKALEHLNEARSMGDLKENGMYTAAKEKQVQLQTRMAELEELLKNADVVDGSATIGGKKQVSFGSKVHLETEKQKVSFLIVGSEEVNAMEGKISHESPIGQALIGKTVGDVVEVKVPVGVIRYKIVDIA
ncbi:MAG: transcription elongation factor GreA [Niabella sp.]|nr:MAG: transcription elongation factor GreA [Niabella sp.]